MPRLDTPGLPWPVALAGRSGESESVTTVLVAFCANVLIAVAKSVAAVLTGSASMVAEAAHSWADAGNEVFLLIAEPAVPRPPDPAHPLGHGREAYVWSLFAALGLFVAGAAVSVTHGVQELIHPEPASDFVVGYVVLAVSVRPRGHLLPAVGAAGQSRRPRRCERTSSSTSWPPPIPTLRAVFAEDAAALVGLLIAAARAGRPPADRFARSRTRSGRSWSVCCSASSRVVLINRNRRFLIGQEADPGCARPPSRRCWTLPEVARVTYLRLEFVGPRMVSVIGDVDLTGDDSRVAPGRPAAGPRGQDQRVARGGRRGAEPVRARRTDAHGLTATSRASATLTTQSQQCFEQV